jgi:hypothetical protein
MKRGPVAFSAALLSFVLIGASQISAADDEVILRAMRDELARSRQLRVIGGGDDGPYFISFGLDDAESFEVAASMGSVLSVRHNRFRLPNIDLRVGSYDFDDTGHIYSGMYTGSRYDSEWPLDDHYNTLRECLWLATDRAYKTALESMARKRAALNSANAPTEKLADFSRVPPVQSVAKPVRKKIDEGAWTSRVAALSSIFNAYPEVRISGVELQSLDGVTYLMNTEGTAIRYDDSLLFAFGKADGQAPDGMYVHDAVQFLTLDLDKPPSEAALRKGLTGVAENIRALSKAPTGASFSGPTLFEPEAAAQLFAQLLGDNVRVPRKPLAEPGRAVTFVASELETKLGSRILPEWIDVVDDPTQNAWHGKALAGYYPFDMEGVAAKAVSVVEKGILKSFLTTRQPVKGVPASNGHARFPGQYATKSAAIGNLFVNASQTVPLADLKKKLIDMCRERSKPYGMLVRKLDYPYSSAGQDLQALAAASGQSGGSVRPVSPPILVYRVYPDGREELVRGLRFRGVSTRSLRDILAASQETTLFDYVNNAAPLAMMGAGGFQAPTAVVAPAVLFDEIEFELPQDQLPKPPIVPPPTGGGAQ